MENVTHEQLMAVEYEPPALVELGEFSEDTLGPVNQRGTDSNSRRRQ